MFGGSLAEIGKTFEWFWTFCRAFNGMLLCAIDVVPTSVLGSYVTFLSLFRSHKKCRVIIIPCVHVSKHLLL